MDAINQKVSLHVQDMLSLDEVLDPQPVQAFPYTKSYSEAENDPFMIIHTSGTTGQSTAIYGETGSSS